MLVVWDQILYPKNWFNHLFRFVNHILKKIIKFTEFTEKCDVHSQSCCFSLYTNSLPGDSRQVWGQGRKKERELAVTSYKIEFSFLFFSPLSPELLGELAWSYYCFCSLLNLSYAYDFDIPVTFNIDLKAWYISWDALLRQICLSAFCRPSAKTSAC